MSSVAQPHTGFDTTELPLIVRGALKLGALEAVIVLAMGLVSRLLDGTLELALLAGFLLLGLTMVTSLPGIWTRARTTEGVAGAAGIGLGAAVVFLVLDLLFLQGNLFPFHLYTNRWLAIGGGSNWWYHPVWWMAGTFIPWMGGWIIANQTQKSGAPSIPGLMFSSLACTVVVAVLAVLAHFPGAGWNLPTFGVAFLPGLAVATLISVLGTRRA
jgi:hypothetical protein